MEKAFIENTIFSLGRDNALILFDAIENTPPVVSVRRNKRKLAIDAFFDNFSGNVDGLVPWCAEGIYLKDRPAFTYDPLLHAGAYYVQDASSMSVSTLFETLRGRMEGGVRVLDLCAAPGGKSTSIASLLDSESLLVSNEVISSRATVLAENMTKWGRAGVAVTSSDPHAFSRLPSFFDIILADVPCSGEGMFRKDANAVAEWSEANVSLCAARQRKIVADAWCSLRPGGYLIYSTCTFNHFENDDNVRWIASTLGADICSMEIEGPVRTETGLQFIPGITMGEGFFCAVLRKDGDERHAAVRNVKVRTEKCNYVVSGYSVMEKDSFIKAVPEALVQDMLFVEQNLKTIRSGVSVAVVKGKDIIPEAALALSEAFLCDAFSTIDLSLGDALKYLRLEPLAFSQMPKGFLLLRYKGVNLGFVKNIGQRSNNLFPPSWRIRN